MTTFVATSILRVQTGLNTGKVYDIRKALRIGRHPYNEVSLPDNAVSRYHCWMTTSEAGCYIEDLASTNGTFVNNDRVQTRQVLKPGDVVRVGMTEFLFTEQE